MNIFVLKKEKLEKLKTIPYEGIFKTRFDNSDFRDLYPLYDEELHIIVKMEVLPEYRKLVDGEIVGKTLYERCIDGEYTLQEGEKIENECIVKVEKTSEYDVWNYEICVYEEDLNAKLLDYQEKCRIKRKIELDAYDKLATNKAAGVTNVESDIWLNIVSWREAWLDLPNTVDINKTLESQYPTTPPSVEYFK